MPKYTLRCVAAVTGRTEMWDFDAETTSAALSVMCLEASGRTVDLLRGKKLICTLRRDADGEFWHLPQLC